MFRSVWSCTKNPKNQYSFGGESLRCVDNEKDLGVTFNSSFTFEDHARNSMDRDKLTGEFFFLHSLIYDARVTVSAEAGCVCIGYNHCAQRLVITDACRRNNIYLQTLSMSRIRDFLVQVEQSLEALG